MNALRRTSRRGATRRTLAAVAVAAVAVLATTPTASAAVTASFSPGTRVLTVMGDGLNNTIQISRDASGRLLVNNGAVAVAGGTATVANTSLIQLFGQAGNDTVLGRGGADFVFGGPDNDTLTGGDADDQVFGESGNDRMVWNPGDDTDLNEGGADSDT